MGKLRLRPAIRLRSQQRERPPLQNSSPTFSSSLERSGVGGPPGKGSLTPLPCHPCDSTPPPPAGRCVSHPASPVGCGGCGARLANPVTCTRGFKHRCLTCGRPGREGASRRKRGAGAVNSGRRDVGPSLSGADGRASSEPSVPAPARCCALLTAFLSLPRPPRRTWPWTPRPPRTQTPPRKK